MNLATALFALGLHQKLKPDLTFVLAETRRKLSGYAYMSDKSFTTFSGRLAMVNGSLVNVRCPWIWRKMIN